MDTQSPRIDELIAEIERYLAAIAVFRALGHEPSWQPEALMAVAANETILQMAGPA